MKTAEETLEKHWVEWVKKVYGHEAVDEESFEQLDKSMFLDAMEEHAHNSVEQLKKEHETHVIALEALAKVLNREKGELREENDKLKSNFLLMSEERDKQLELVDKLRKERDEFARDFYKWAAKMLERFPGKKTLNSLQLLSEYKKTLEP